jgi:hypothetical protein
MLLQEFPYLTFSFVQEYSDVHICTLSHTFVLKIIDDENFCPPVHTAIMTDNCSF